jgi:hypothetical protein
MNGRFIVFGISVVTLVGLAACGSEKTVDPTHGVTISVDSAVYHLQPWFEFDYGIQLTVTVANEGDQVVFLSQDCGSRFLMRADSSDKTRLFLGSYACIESPRQTPLHIDPGQSYSRTLRLTGSHSPLTRPPITIENNTGTMVFGYVFTDPDGRPISRVHSTPFRVEPPADSSPRPNTR